MDANMQRKVVSGPDRMRDSKLKKWLKQKFASGGGGGGNQHQQSSTGQFGQPYQGQQGQGQQSQWGQQPQQQQPYNGQSQYEQNQQSYAQPHQNYGHQQQSYPQPGYGGQQPSHQWNQADHEPSQSSVNDLRNQAIREGDLMKQAFDQAHAAHERGDGAAAKQFSNQGHAHQANKERLNAQASDLIYQEKNSTQPRGTVDLHGLYVQEAIHKTEQAIQEGQRSGLRELRVIVGKGNHSTMHVAKIKPAIEDLMQKYGLGAELDPHNAGVLIVHLDGSGGSRDAGHMTRELAKTQEGDQDQCVIS